MVTDDDLKSSLSMVTPEIPEDLQEDTVPAGWTSYNYYINDSEISRVDGNMKPSNSIMLYSDVELPSGEKYRAIYIISYRPMRTKYNKKDVDNGAASIQEQHGYSLKQIYWFKYEPIQWRVLDPETGLVFSEKTIDSQPYNNCNDDPDYFRKWPIEYGDDGNIVYSADYGRCSLRDWLNNDFYNAAFTQEKQNGILTVSFNSYYDKLYNFYCHPSNNTVFLLSRDDVKNTKYGFSGEINDDALLSNATDYACAQGLTTCYWLLRRSESDTLGYSYASVVNGKHVETNSYSQGLDHTNFGVRPAICLNELSLDIVSMSNDSNYDKYNIPDGIWNANQFEQSSAVPNKALAYASALMSDAAEDGADSILGLYNKLGFKDGIAGNYNEKGSSCYAIGHDVFKVGNKELYVLVITARGTGSGEEAVGDWLKGPKVDFLGLKVHHNVYEFYMEIWNGIEYYLAKHPDINSTGSNKFLKILVNGHSLGGAAANLVAARYSYYSDGRFGDSWWSKLGVKQGDVFGYTFGAIKAIYCGEDVLGKGIETNIAPGYENIHNIYNIVDTYGPYGGCGYLKVSSLFCKFGVTYLFSNQPIPAFLDNNPLKPKNHLMAFYLTGLLDEQYKLDFNKRYINYTFHCPIDVEIYENEKLVGRVVNNEVDTEVTTIPMAVIDDTKYVLLEEGKNYNIKTTASDSGNLTIEVQNAVAGEGKTFSDISLYKGKQFLLSTDDVADAKDTELFVVDEYGNKTAEVQTDGSEKPIGVKLSFWQRIIQWFKDLFAKIKEIFSN